MAAASTSLQLRQEGNKLYSSASTDFCPAVRKGRLEKALYKYNQSLRCACNDIERCSAFKNIGMANWKLGNLSCEDDEKKTQHYFFKEAIKSFSESHNLGSSCQSYEWCGSIIQSFYQCVQDAMDGLDDLALPVKAPILEQYVYLMKVDCIRAEYCIELAKQYLHEAVVKHQQGDTRQSLSYLKECHRPIQEAAQTGDPSLYIISEVNILEADCLMQTCISESVQARNIGDNLLDTLLQTEESLNMDLVWDIVDWYKQAIILTREIDVEMEAIALSRLGRVYDKVIKLKYKATESFKRAIQLAISLHPRTFDSEDWFKECRSTLERYQKEVVEQDSDIWKRERAPFVIELKEELKTLGKTKLKSAEVFLKFIYDNFPPKNANHTLKDVPSTNDDQLNLKLKKLLKTAIVHYHPDRQDVEKYGKKWKVLCEEITKCLTSKYETYKIPDKSRKQKKEEESEEWPWGTEEEGTEEEETEGEESEGEESEEEESEEEESEEEQT